MGIARSLAAFAVLVAAIPPAAAAEEGPEIHPAVVSVSSGPWVWASGNYHFRAVTVQDGGLIALHVQKIELDPESETLSVVKSFPVDLASVSQAAYEIDGIRWSSADAFLFRLNSKLYAIRGLDGEPEITLAGHFTIERPLRATDWMAR